MVCARAGKPDGGAGIRAAVAGAVGRPVAVGSADPDDPPPAGVGGARRARLLVHLARPPPAGEGRLRLTTQEEGNIPMNILDILSGSRKSAMPAPDAALP